ncbi:hypothetical protein CHELA40_12943 [Chelatococcus asaccharovorans]|nr:hypothetical protein CHELA40_12943 [Chelatococcus asaccharovorans]CAH1681127.1 hypothetical protein CHELA17_62676 [Chelatococcus asaccharovorans]
MGRDLSCPVAETHKATGRQDAAGAGGASPADATCPARNLWRKRLAPPDHACQRISRMVQLRLLHSKYFKFKLSGHGYRPVFGCGRDHVGGCGGAQRHSGSGVRG